MIYLSSFNTHYVGRHWWCSRHCSVAKLHIVRSTCMPNLLELLITSSSGAIVPDGGIVIFGIPEFPGLVQVGNGIITGTIIATVPRTTSVC